MFSIFRDLFVNWTIIVAFITFGNLIRRERYYRTTNKSRVLIAIYFGIVGCFMVLYGIKITPTMIIDFRLIPIMIMGIYFTPATTMITAIIIGIFRISARGLNNSSIIGFAVAIFIGLFCGLTGRLNVSVVKKWILSLLAACVMSGIAFSILISDKILFSAVLIAFSVSLVLVTALTYILLNYLNDSNHNYSQLQNASSIDFLTGLNNVKYFHESLDYYLNYAKEKPQNLALLFIDIDFFKKINDSYGHLSGDLVLKEVARILTKYSRDKDIVSRIGGEEFTIILVDCGVTEAKLIAERIRNAIIQHDITMDNGRILKTTVSIGISSFPQPASDKVSLIKQADVALYQAKKSGRNEVHVFDSITSYRVPQSTSR